MGADRPFTAAAVAETHSGAVFFLGDRAYKVKKPVDGFLTSAPARVRVDACRREVVLNRWLAPDAYLGVADVFGPDANRATTWWSCGGCRPAAGCRR